MEFRHLRYFDAVASTLSFSKAAERLHMSQPPLSRQIRQLEDELCAELIDRASRPLSLTPAGRFFHDQAQQILQRMSEAQQATRRIAQGRKAWFGIGFVPSTLYGPLPELIRRMRDEHPDMELGLQEMMTIEQGDALKTGVIDVGFGRLPLNDPAIACETIAEELLVVAVSAVHDFARRSVVTLADLAREPLILYPARPRPSYADQVLAVFRDRGLMPQVVLEANELQTAIGLVSAGVGMALVPESVQRLHRNDVAYLPLSDEGVRSPVIMNTRRGDRSEGLSAFRLMVAATVTSRMSTDN